MKRIYMLFIAAAFAFTATAQEADPIVNVDFSEFTEEAEDALEANYRTWADAALAAGEPFAAYGNPYLNFPEEIEANDGTMLLLLGARNRKGATIDILKDDFVVDAGTGNDGDLPGAIIFTVPSISKIEVASRSGSNTVLENPDRHLYIAVKDAVTGEFNQVSQDFELAWGDPITESYEWETEITEEVTIAIKCKALPDGGENMRVHSFKVWGAISNSIGSVSKANVNIVAVAGEIRVAGDVASIEVINLAGSTVLSVAGVQNISTSSLSGGVYLVKATDNNGLTKVEKVVVR